MWGRTFGGRRTGRALATAAALAALTGTLAACGTDTSGDSGGGGGGKTTLTLKALTDNKPGWVQLIAAYKKAEPDVTIQASYAPVDDIQTSLRAQLGGGNAPDVFTVWPGNGSAMAVKQLAPAGLLADLSDQSWISHVPEGAKPLLGDDGKTYIWSPSTTPIGVIYNKKVFEDAGVQIPKTWDEFLAAAEKLKSAGKIPIALGNQTPWVTQLISYAIAPSTAFADDPDLAQEMLDGDKSFEDSRWRDVFERYMELDKRGLFNDDPNGTTFEQTTNMVATGKAGMVVQVTGVIPTIVAAAKSPSDLGTFPFPAADSAAELKIPAGISAGLGVSAKGPNLDAAKKFVEFAGREENMAAFAKSQFAIPLAGGSGELDPLVKPFASYIEDGNYLPFMDQQWPNAEVQPTHFAGIQELFAGKTTIPELLKTLDEAYQKR